MGKKITLTEAAFACYSKVCAPPPAGRGGSSSSGKTRSTLADIRKGDKSVAGWNERMAKEKQQRADIKTAYARIKRRKDRGEKINMKDAISITKDAARRAKNPKPMTQDELRQLGSDLARTIKKTATTRKM